MEPLLAILGINFSLNHRIPQGPGMWQQRQQSISNPNRVCNLSGSRYRGLQTRVTHLRSTKTQNIYIHSRVNQKIDLDTTDIQ